MPDHQEEKLLVVNSTEWLNLIARRQIRMLRRRVLTLTTQPSRRDMHRLFALAPFTKLDSSVDVFVLKIADTWPDLVSKHPMAANEISWLPLDFVVDHHPVSAKDLPYYQSIADKVGVRLSPADFETHWNDWVFSETLTATGDAAGDLQTWLGVPTADSLKRPDKYLWTDVARLVLQPHKVIKPKPGHLESLLSGVRSIADAVSDVRDSQAFFVACAIEWIDLRLKRDPLKKKADREEIESALAEIRSAPLTPVLPRTREALDRLAAVFPRAYTDEITPMTVAGIVQLLADYRSQRLKTVSVVEAVDRVGRETPGATLILEALAAALGPEFTYQLIEGMKTAMPVDVDWTSATD